MGVQVISVPILLPLIVVTLDQEDLVIYFLITNIIQLALVADFGFNATFIRYVSYGYAGASLSELSGSGGRGALSIRRPEESGSDWESIRCVQVAMSWVYGGISTFIFVALLGAGSWVIFKLINAEPNSSALWAAWFFVVFSTAASFYGNIFSNYLYGTNHIASQKRVEVVIQLLSVVSIVVSLWLGGGIVGLLVAQQFWRLVLTVALGSLSKKVNGGFGVGAFGVLNRDVLASVWRAAWRSGVGVFSQVFSTRACIIYLGRTAPPEFSASFMFAMQLIDKFILFCNVPFYVKIPKMAMLAARFKLDDLAEVAKRNMTIGLSTFIALGVLTQVSGSVVLDFIGSNVAFLSPEYWMVLCVGFIFQRYGAQHAQLYSCTNHIIWHWLNGTSGVLILIAFLTLTRYVGYLSFPLSVLLVSAVFYVPISVNYSLGFLKKELMEFEGVAGLAMISVIALWIVICLWRYCAIDNV